MVRLAVTTRNGGVKIVTLKNVRHVPTLQVNVISQTKMREQGWGYHAPPKKKGRAMPNAYVTAPDGTEVQFKTHNGLGHWVGAASTGDYAHPHVNLVSEFQAAAQVATKSELLESLTSPAITGNKHKHHAVRMALARLQTYVSKTPSVDAYLKLHCKLGHAGVRRVAEYAKAHGIELDPVARAFVQQCITYEVAKAKMHSKNKKDTGKLEAALPLWGKVFCDVWEPGKKIRSVRTGYKYIIRGFIDAATNSGRIYGMISTKEVPTTIKRFLNDIHNERKRPRTSRWYSTRAVFPTQSSIQIVQRTLLARRHRVYSVAITAPVRHHHRTTQKRMRR
jgi:hypothetical protein